MRVEQEASPPGPRTRCAFGSELVHLGLNAVKFYHVRQKSDSTDLFIGGIKHVIRKRVRVPS